MKKSFIVMLLLAVTGFVFMSCDKDDDEPGTYICTSYLRGTYDILLFEYNSSGDKIYDHTMSDCVYGCTCTYRAQPEATKLKVLLKGGYLSSDKWVQRVYILKPGEVINIDLYNSDIVGPEEP